MKLALILPTCAAPLVRATSWGLASSTTDYVQQTRQDLLVMVQVECPQGVAAIDEIANVEGVDGIFLGLLDLSASLGRMGDFDHPDFQALMGRAEQAVRESPAFLAGFRAPGRSVQDMFETAGYQRGPWSVEGGCQGRCCGC